jgi:hypothetical protein
MQREPPSGAYFFDSPACEQLIDQYQKTDSRETLGEILARCQPITESLIRSRATFLHEDEDELISIVNGKLIKSLWQYHPSRGAAFAFVSRLTVNMLVTTVTYKRKLRGAVSAFGRDSLSDDTGRGSGIQLPARGRRFGRADPLD